jgi:hypothetical protein
MLDIAKLAAHGEALDRQIAETRRPDGDLRDPSSTSRIGCCGYGDADAACRQLYRRSFKRRSHRRQFVRSVRRADAEKRRSFQIPQSCFPHLVISPSANRLKQRSMLCRNILRRDHTILVAPSKNARRRGHEFSTLKLCCFFIFVCLRAGIPFVAGSL